jgi:hypothetical protein
MENITKSWGIQLSLAIRASIPKEGIKCLKPNTVYEFKPFYTIVEHYPNGVDIINMSLDHQLLNEFNYYN